MKIRFECLYKTLKQFYLSLVEVDFLSWRSHWLIRQNIHRIV